MAGPNQLAVDSSHGYYLNSLPSSAIRRAVSVVSVVSRDNSSSTSLGAGPRHTRKSSITLALVKHNILPATSGYSSPRARKVSNNEARFKRPTQLGEKTAIGDRTSPRSKVTSQTPPIPS